MARTTTLQSETLQMEQKLSQLISKVFNVPQNSIQDSTEIRSLESWDSLKHMELIAALESGFNVELSFEEIVSINNINDIKNILSSK